MVVLNIYSFDLQKIGRGLWGLVALSMALNWLVASPGSATPHAHPSACAANARAKSMVSQGVVTTSRIRKHHLEGYMWVIKQFFAFIVPLLTHIVEGKGT